MEQACVAIRAREQALDALEVPESAAFLSGKLQAARYFFRYELPRVDAWLDCVEGVDTTALDMREDWF